MSTHWQLTENCATYAERGRRGSPLSTVMGKSRRI